MFAGWREHAGLFDDSILQVRGARVPCCCRYGVAHAFYAGRDHPASLPSAAVVPRVANQPCMLSSPFSSHSLIPKTLGKVAEAAAEMLADPANNTIILSGCGTSGRVAFFVARAFNLMMVRKRISPAATHTTEPLHRKGSHY